MNADEVLQMAEDRFERRLVEETSALRQENAANFAGVHSEIAQLRQEVRDGFAGLRIEMTGTRTEMAGEMASMRTDMAEWKADMFKWMFAFWTGQCFAILGFLFLLSRNR